MGYNDRAQNVSYNITPSDTILLSNLTERTSSTDSTWVLVKELELVGYIQPTSLFRFKFEGKVGSGSWAGKAKIFRNGSAIGTERVLTTTYTNFIEDIASTTWVVGDLIQLCLYSSGNPSYPAYCRNFYLCGSPSEFLNTLGA